MGYVWRHPLEPSWGIPILVLFVNKLQGDFSIFKKKTWWFLPIYHQSNSIKAAVIFEIYSHSPGEWLKNFDICRAFKNEFTNCFLSVYIICTNNMHQMQSIGERRQVIIFKYEIFVNSCQPTIVQSFYFQSNTLEVYNDLIFLEATSH